MAITVRPSPQTGTDGATADLAGTAFSSEVNTGGTCTWETDGTPPSGFTWLRFVANTTTSTSLYKQQSVTPTDEIAVDFDIYLESKATTGEIYFFQLMNGSSRCLAIAFDTTTNKIRCRDAANGAKWAGATTSTFALSLNTTYRISLWMERNSTTGRFRVVIYAADGTTVLEDTGIQSNINTGSAAVDNYRIGGRVSSGNNAITVRYTRIRHDELATTNLAAPSVVPPTIGTKSSLAGVFLKYTGTTWPGGSGGTFTASPNTGVEGNGNGVFLPCALDGTPSNYTVVATDTATGATSEVAESVALDVSGGGAGNVRYRTWDGSAWD